MGLLGAHMSIAGGLYRAIERGDELGCAAIQIFTQSSRTWKSTPLTEEEISLFTNALAKATTVSRVIAHNSYLLNLSTADNELRKKSVAYTIETMNRCEQLGIESLVTHPGSHLGAGVEAGVKATGKSLNEILKACRGYKTLFVLENTAGQGACLGHRFEELSHILEEVSEPERIGFCFDTQHAFAAGYDIRTPEIYGETMEMFDHFIGLKKLKAFHINDALKDLGSRVDRHENIGKGFLGKESFRPLVNDARFADIPMCLETFPGEEDENFKQDLKALRSLISAPSSQPRRIKQKL